MLIELSKQMADVVETVAASVVQVQGQRRPASGLVAAADQVLTTHGAVGRDERPRVRRSDGRIIEAELAGWDPTTRLVLLSAPGLDLPPLAPAPLPRVGEIAMAVARSWSNSVTVTAGLVSVIGGPLHMGRRRSIETIIRTSAPMHEGFAGGALVGVDGTLLGIATAAAIRGLGVVIPAESAWRTAADLVQRGGMKRGYIGIAAQPARVSEKQKEASGADTALLVISVKDGTPAADAGLMVGDLLLSLDGHTLSSPEDLLDLLIGERVGRAVNVRVLRGGAATELSVNVGERR